MNCMWRRLGKSFTIIKTYCIGGVITNYFIFIRNVRCTEGITYDKALDWRNVSWSQLQQNRHIDIYCALAFHHNLRRNYIIAKAAKNKYGNVSPVSSDMSIAGVRHQEKMQTETNYAGRAKTLVKYRSSWT